MMDHLAQNFYRPFFSVRRELRRVNRCMHQCAVVINTQIDFLAGNRNSAHCVRGGGLRICVSVRRRQIAIQPVIPPFAAEDLG
jgi:hypothetical protein